MSWFAHAVACSLYAVTFGTFFVHLIECAGLLHFPTFGFGLHFYEKLLAVLMISAFAYINFRGAEETGKAGVILGLFVGFGIWATLQ
jgi:amino acid transporter